MVTEAAVAPRLFTAEEYQQMAKAGILLEDDRVELIQGKIIQRCPAGRSPIGDFHAAIVSRLNMLLAPRLAP